MNHDNSEPASEISLAAEMAKLLGWEKRLGITEVWVDELGFVRATVAGWRPDRDISAAWLVVEKMREDDFWWSAVFKEVYIDPGLITQAGYEVKFRCARGGTRGEHLGFADTLPLAICLAARAAVDRAAAE